MKKCFHIIHIFLSSKLPTKSETRNAQTRRFKGAANDLRAEMKSGTLQILAFPNFSQRRKSRGGGTGRVGCFLPKSLLISRRFSTFYNCYYCHSFSSSSRCSSWKCVEEVVSSRPSFSSSMGFIVYKL